MFFLILHMKSEPISLFSFAAFVPSIDPKMEALRVIGIQFDSATRAWDEMFDFHLFLFSCIHTLIEKAT